MRAHEIEPIKRVFGEPEIVELGLDDDGNRQWYMATREGFGEVGENGVLQLDMKHFEVGTRLTLEEPFPSDAKPQHLDVDGEDSSHEDEHDCGEGICVCR